MSARGCVLCQQGAKMVLFITGVCRRACWYCPLSRERKGQDRIFANEKEISSPEEAVVVAQLMSALGTGITGGEPLDRIERVVAFARVLKEAFGTGHHIHLYTSRAPGTDDLQNLAGLVDEIRMHPPAECWDHIRETEYRQAVCRARDMGFSVGFEVPALPKIGLLEAVLPDLDFLTINELEWGETNADEMRRRGFAPEDSIHNAVAGSRDWAAEISRHDKVRFCSSRFKDSVQLRERLLRIARNTARPFDEVTGDGTVVYGVVENEGGIPSAIREYGEDMFESRDGTIETAWWILVEERARIGGKKSVIERYPDRGMVVEVSPVP
ncbi:MAG: radical SAM protein [Methanomicrobiales archaeon]|nr:radical SAM protein [Methanomicrobiales archaeon]